VIFTETGMAGVYLIDIEPQADERGFFARAWCQDELAQHGLESRLSQFNMSGNVRRGTLRGMHYQVAPYEEVKILRCVSGAVWDAVVDLREGSPTHGRWIGHELTAENRRAVYVPAGFAHGYQALTDGAEVLYSASEPYRPGAERGLRWDDPAFGIKWPVTPPILSEKDAAWPDYPGGG
jgi:dTDP-4-dehydrorhamnose 3,5-epimerase